MLTEAQTRDIKDTLPKITERVKSEVDDDDDPTVAAEKINQIVEDERASIRNDTPPSDSSDDDGHGDSFQDLDPEGSASREDRLSASDSGSTVDIDLDADIDGDDPTDQLNDYASDLNEDEQTLSYLFSYFDTLPDPSKVAKNYSGDIDATRDHVENILKWFTAFKKQLG